MTAIYAHHVLHSTGTFEENPPTDEAMKLRWLEREAAGQPTLVCCVEGAVVGFACAGTHKPRSAYRFTVEDSVYVGAQALGRGIGYALLNQLIVRCSELNYRQMMAVIGDSANQASIRLHERCGFEPIGTARGIGYKHGRWLDIVYMQRTL